MDKSQLKSLIKDRDVIIVRQGDAINKLEKESHQKDLYIAQLEDKLKSSENNYHLLSEADTVLQHAHGTMCWNFARVEEENETLKKKIQNMELQITWLGRSGKSLYMDEVSKDRKVTTITTIDDLTKEYKDHISEPYKRKIKALESANESLIQALSNIQYAQNV